MNVPFPDDTTLLIAELSANHRGDLEYAVNLVKAAADAGADAVKAQTYTADTMTLDCDSELFRSKNPIREGRTLYSIYQEGSLPWEWHAKLKAIAEDNGLIFFSTPFDASSVAFLETLHVPWYKVASFEVVDIPLLKVVAATGKPVIMSTGMATLGEIDEAVLTLRDNGAESIALLKCTSAYPAPYEAANLRTIPHLAEAFACPAGLSDHTPGFAVTLAAVALGARIIEKHFTLSRADGGLDASFSMEPHEFAAMADNIRIVEKALGSVRYARTEKEEHSAPLRRSLFVAEDMKAGDSFTDKNVRCIRPGQGLHPRYFDVIKNKKALRDIKKGTPLSWALCLND